MSDLTPRPNRTPRRVREQRAYQLVLAGGGSAAVAVVTGILAIVGVLGWWLPVLAVVLAAVFGLLFQRTVS